MKRILFAIVIALVAAGFAFAGGGGDKKAAPKGFEWVIQNSKDDPSGILPGVDPLKVNGDIVTSGSSTVFPLSERIAARFNKEGYKGTIKLDSIGSGAGLERLVKGNGEVDIANSSRGINEKELATAKGNGVDTIEFKVGTDALAIITNKSNTFLKNVTPETLAKLFTATKWSDVDPSYPNQNIIRFIPSTEHGTFDYFAEVIFKKAKEPLLNAPNTQPNQDYNLLVTGVEGNPYALGFIGFAYYNEQKSRLNVVDVNGVTPSAQSVAQNKYWLSRPLFMYVDSKTLKNKPQVAAFIDYYLTYVNQEIGKVGYFPLQGEEITNSKNTWVNQLKGLLK